MIMRVLAFFLSPFTGCVLAFLSYNFIADQNQFTSIDFNELTIFYSISLIVQFLYVEFIFLFSKKNFTNYLNISYVTCTIIGIFSYIISKNNPTYRISESIDIFIFFLIYSIGNSLTYNYLYFENQK